MKTTLNAFALLALSQAYLSAAVTPTLTWTARYPGATAEPILIQCNQNPPNQGATLFIQQKVDALNADPQTTIPFTKELLLLCYDTTVIKLVVKDPDNKATVKAYKTDIARQLSDLATMCSDKAGHLDGGRHFSVEGDYDVLAYGVEYGQCDKLPAQIKADGGQAYQWPN